MKEVSLVDTPANEEEWLEVLKRLGGNTMTTPNTEPNAEAAAPPDDTSPLEPERATDAPVDSTEATSLGESE